MSTPITTAELLQGDLWRHDPSMAQYLGVTFRALAGDAIETHIADTLTCMLCILNIVITYYLLVVTCPANICPQKTAAPPLSMP